VRRNEKGDLSVAFFISGPASSSARLRHRFVVFARRGRPRRDAPGSNWPSSFFSASLRAFSAILNAPSSPYLLTENFTRLRRPDGSGHEATQNQRCFSSGMSRVSDAQ
jgi:hypothetical protein